MYGDSGWILSRIILIAGGRRSKVLLLREDDDRCTRIWDRRTDGQTDRRTESCYCGRRTIGVPRLGLDFVTNNFNCGRMTIGVPGFGTDRQIDRQTGGQKIVIAGGERSVYRDSGWILSRIILIAGERRSMY